MWLSWWESQPVHGKVEGSTPNQGTNLSCGFCPPSGCLKEAIDIFHIDLSLSLSPFLSLKSILKYPQVRSFLKKDIPVPEDSERTSEPSWRENTFVTGALRAGLRKYSGD